MNPAPAIPAQGQTETRPKLLYLVTEDWYFCSHRIAHAAPPVTLDLR